MQASPSQIENYRLCKRKWGYRLLDGLKEPTSPNQQFGIDGHKRIEQWYSLGAPIGLDPVGELITIALRRGYLPPTGVELILEGEMGIPFGGSGDRLMGYVDMIILGDVPVVIDHKFRGDLRFIKEEDELRHDVQAIVYSAFVLFAYPEAPEVVNRWVWYSRKTKQVKTTEIRRSRLEVVEAMKPIWEDVEEMFQLRRLKIPAKELPCSHTACGAYGGCFFRDICQPEDKDAFKAIMRQRGAFAKENTMGLMDKLREMQKGVNPLPTTTATTPASPPEEKVETAPAVEKASAPAQSIKDKIAASKKATTPPPAEPPPPAEVAPAEVTEEPPKRGRGRPPKAAQAPAKAPEPITAPEAPTRATETKPTPPANGKGLLVVLFDAAVTKAPADQKITHLVELLAPVMAQVAEAKEKPHWALLPYGSGKAELAVAFDTWLSESNWKGTILVDGSSQESQAVREVLIAHADVIYRGV